GFLERSVLHLQFELIDLQFVHKPLGVGFGSRRGRMLRLSSEPSFDTTAQFGGIGNDSKLFLHGQTSYIDRPPAIFTHCFDIFANDVGRSWGLQPKKNSGLSMGLYCLVSASWSFANDVSFALVASHGVNTPYHRCVIWAYIHMAI